MSEERLSSLAVISMENKIQKRRNTLQIQVNNYMTKIYKSKVIGLNDVSQIYLNRTEKHTINR